jgi:hypothetical protein
MESKYDPANVDHFDIFEDSEDFEELEEYEEDLYASKLEIE